MNYVYLRNDVCLLSVIYEISNIVIIKKENTL